MSRYTRIICTLGPASMKEKMLVKMAKRGMNLVRINCSHGDYQQHKKMIDLVRSIDKKYGFKINILLDLEGYRIRIGKLKKNVILQRSQIFYLTQEPEQYDNHIPFDYTEDLKDIKKGANVFIDDGKLHLRVMGHSSKSLKVKVIQGGILKERKGVNIPHLKLQSDILTDNEKANIELATENRVDKISQSFVRNRKDVHRVAEIVKKRHPGCMVIAKIENEEGVRNLESIIDGCDGVMVARGDLGVTMPIHKIPMIQKYIIRHCNRKKKLSIIATQMLDSMIENGRPTRAEVSDVANAVLDGTDYVMLSGETAIGRYPSRSVMVMSQIVEYTENHVNIQPK